jgi:hypothetical protein
VRHGRASDGVVVIVAGWVRRPQFACFRVRNLRASERARDPRTGDAIVVASGAGAAGVGAFW